MNKILNWKIKVDKFWKWFIQKLFLFLLTFTKDFQIQEETSDTLCRDIQLFTIWISIFFCVRVILPPKTGSMETIKSGFQSWSSSSSQTFFYFSGKFFCTLMYVCTFVFNKINTTYQRHHQKCLLPCCTWVGCSRNDSRDKISCLSWRKEKLVRTQHCMIYFFCVFQDRCFVFFWTFLKTVLFCVERTTQKYTDRN